MRRLGSGSRARSRVRGAVALAMGVAVAIASVAAAGAASKAFGFNDVPADFTHGENIEWAKDNGITVGCSTPDGPNFCPLDPVTRGQMVTFMRNLAESRTVDAATLEGLTAADFLRAGEPIDADTLDGIEPDDLRRIELDPRAAGGEGTRDHRGAVLVGSGLERVAFTVPVPSTFTPGTDLRVTALIVTTGGPCDVHTSITVEPIAAGEPLPTGNQGIDPKDTTLTTDEMAETTHVATLETVEPGSALAVNLARASGHPNDNCGTVYVQRVYAEFGPSA